MTTIEEKLIVAVFNHPELYNVSAPGYRNSERRNRAWSHITAQMGLSRVECKRKWRNLRDRYLKEIRKDIKGKNQGKVTQSQWKYKQMMNFIAPYVGSRSSAVGIGVNTPDCQSGGFDEMSSLSDRVNKTPQFATMAAVTTSNMISETMMAAAPEDTQIAAMAKTPLTPWMTPISNAQRKRKREQTTPSLRTLMASKGPVEDNGLQCSCRPQDEDELFLLSFVPALKRLTSQKRCETKIKIQRIMFEAEFNVTLLNDIKTEISD